MKKENLWFPVLFIKNHLEPNDTVLARLAKICAAERLKNTPHQPRL